MRSLYTDDIVGKVDYNFRNTIQNNRIPKKHI